MVKKETLPLRAQINGKDLGRTVFDLVLIPHKAILGIPWLEKTNLSIDWHTRRITLRRKNSGKSTPQHRRIHIVEIFEILQKQMRRIQHQEFHRIYPIWMKPVSGQLNATQEEDKA